MAKFATTVYLSCALSAAASSALYLPAGVPVYGGFVSAGSGSSGISAIWGTNGYSTGSFSPGFGSQMSGQFGPNGGAVSDSITRVQLPPAVPGQFPPFANT